MFQLLGISTCAGEKKLSCTKRGKSYGLESADVTQINERNAQSTDAVPAEPWCNPWAPLSVQEPAP